MERNNEFLNSILHGISDSFPAVDNEEHLSFLNHNAEVLLGRDRETVLGKHFRIVIPES